MEQSKRTIYVAGIDRKAFCGLAAPVNAWLLSAGYLKNLPLWILGYLSGRRVLWDPGVFSTKAQCQITLDEYRAYQGYHHRPGMRWLSFDVMGDPEQTLWNLRRLRAEGRQVVPVYHRGMPADVLREPDVAIGGLVPLSGEDLAGLLDWVFFEVKPPGQTHLLGVHNRTLFERYPATAGDSTSWQRWLKFREGKPPEEFLAEYGDVDIQLTAVQRRLAV